MTENVPDRLVAFLHEVLSRHVVPKDLQTILSDLKTDEETQHSFKHRLDPHLTAYVTEIGEWLLHSFLISVRSDRALAKHTTKELQETKKLLATERESLTAFLQSRINQQKSALDATYISEESKTNMRFEVGLLERYLDHIIKGGHRTDVPSLAGIR